MKRYFSSFFIAIFFYTLFGVGIFYTFANDKIIIEKTKETKIISLNHIELKDEVLVQQTEIKEQNPILEVKQEIQTPKPIIQKKIEKKVIEKKIVEKNEQKPIQKVEENSNTKVLDNPTFTKKEIHSEPPVVDEKKEYLDKYLVQIRESINQNIKYPQKAKKLSIEGIVIVKFKITESGIVEDILIIDGHKFLQNSTIEAIVEASKSFPKINKSIEIQIPIEYKLI